VLLKPQSSRGEWLRAHVFVAVAQDVEEKERRRLFAFGARDLAGASEADAMLNLLKSKRHAGVTDGDDLAVEQHGLVEFGRDLREGRDDGGELGGFVVAVARVETHDRLREAFQRRPEFDEGTDAVVLRLVHQPRLRHRGHIGRGQHRPHGRRRVAPLGHGKF
jgi:hypothetical protein